MLQQYLPLAVLKLSIPEWILWDIPYSLQQYLPLAVLKLGDDTVLQIPKHSCCNSTYRLRYWNRRWAFIARFFWLFVATVPTACGIETVSTLRRKRWRLSPLLQQYLPLAVLKPSNSHKFAISFWKVATVPTACGIETSVHYFHLLKKKPSGCNSTYRLRYWNRWFGAESTCSGFVVKLQQYLPLAVLKLTEEIVDAVQEAMSLQQYLPLAVLKPIDIS